jgi:hypothetical protein
MRFFWQDYCICLCILVALFRLPVPAADVTLGWRPGPDPAITGYNLYCGGASGSYTGKISAGNATNVTVSGLIPGTIYYFAVTTFSAAGLESLFSAEISYQVPLRPTTNQPPPLNASAGSRPVLTCALTNQAALIGQTRSFAVKAAGKGALKYQWKFNGSVLASAVSSKLTLKNVTAGQSGVYSVTVTDRSGSTNSAATLTVYASPAGKLASAGLANGHYTLAVQSVPGCRYIVEAATNFANWIPVATNTAPFTFVESQAGRYRQRFYRAVYVP